MNSDSSPQIVVIGSDVAATAIAQAAIANGISVLSLSATRAPLGLAGGYIGESLQTLPDWMQAPSLTSGSSMSVISTAGTLHRPSVKLRSLLDLSSIASKSIAVVALSVGAEWDAQFLCNALHEAAFTNAQVLTIASEVESTTSLLEFARWADREGSVDIIAGALINGGRPFDVYLFPPVLGLAKLDIAQKLAARLGAIVGECSGAPDSPATHRLASVFGQWLAPMQTVLESSPKVLTDPRLMVTAGSGTWYPQAVVLATGSLLDGGIEFDQAFVEPVTEAPVFETLANGTHILVSGSAERGMDPSPLFAPSFDGSIRAGNIGVSISEDGHILSRDNRTALHDGLYAVGSVVSSRRDGFRRGSGAELAIAIRVAERLARRVKELSAGSSATR